MHVRHRRAEAQRENGNEQTAMGVDEVILMLSISLSGLSCS